MTMKYQSIPMWNAFLAIKWLKCLSILLPIQYLAYSMPVTQYSCVRMTSRCSHFVALSHDDVIKWKHFPRHWPFVRGIHRSPVISPHKGQWRGALMFSLICTWMNGRVNNREAGDLRRHRLHYDVTVMKCGWSSLSEPFFICLFCFVFLRKYSLVSL